MTKNMDIIEFGFGVSDGGTITLTKGANGPTPLGGVTTGIQLTRNTTRSDHSFYVNSGFIVSGSSAKAVITSAGKVKADRNGIANIDTENS
jgi:hypothetical protein